MSNIKTMKGQTSEYLGSAPTWPVDFPLACLFPLNEATGAPGANIYDAIKLSVIAASTHTNNANNTATSLLFAPTTLTTKDAVENSFIWFYVGTLPTNAELCNINSTSGNGSFTITTAAGVGCRFDDFATSAQQVTTNILTSAAADQLVMVVVDRTAKTVSFYEGTNGTTLKFTYALGTGGSFTGLNVLTSATLTNCYGFGYFIFAQGIPSNWPAMLLHVATELRAGRKFAFMNTIVEDYLL